MRCFRFLITLVICAGVLFSCKQSKFLRHVGTTQGTYYRITYQSQKGVDYEKEIIQLLGDFSASLSIYNPNSLISRINHNDQTAVIDDYFRVVFNKAVEVNSASDGVFDITIAPLVNLWGFGFTGDEPEISPKKIDSLMQYVGMEKIRIEGDKVVKDLSGVMLDMNSIAKGYAADVVADFLRSKGSRNFLVDIGGESVASGVNENGNIWRILVEKPIYGAGYGEFGKAVVFLDNRAIATSGNYRRFHEIDGVKYAHTIDVKTGYPVMHNLLSVTIVADDCITADAWATACMASGLEKSIILLEKHPELDALLIYSDENGDFKTHATKGLEAFIYE